MKNYICFILFFIISNNLFSQNTYSIHATVTDRNDSLIFGNIIALSVVDSTIIKGTYYLDGKAELTEINQSKILIKLTSFGYKDTIIYVNNVNNNKTYFLGEIILESTSLELDGVTITARIPLFEPSKEGGLKVNVQKTMLATSSSVREVLTKTPNVIVGDNVVSVFGKGEALLYLNGKQITIERLDAIQVNQIKEIQILTSPSAKYDAQGRAVINIITVVNYSEGVNGVFTQNLTQAKNFLSGSSLNLNYRKNKFSISADYGILLGRDWVSMTGTREINTPSGVYMSSYNQTEESRYANVSNYRLGLGYKLSTLSDISLEYSGNYNWFDLDLIGGNNVISPVGMTTDFETTTYGDLININHSIIANYNRTLDTIGSTLFFGGQFSDYSNSPNEIIEEYIFVNNVLNNSAMRLNRGSNDIQIFIGQVDYSKVLREKGIVELGSKIARTANLGKLDFFTKGMEDDEYTSVQELSNDYQYTEIVPAAYLQYKGSFDNKADYSLGIRFEYTDAHGMSNISDSTLIDTSYLNFFPNASINWILNDNWNLGLNYSRRIDRPRFQSLDPFVWYQDSLTSRAGNPFLKPEMTHAFETSVGYKAYSLKAGYNYSLNHFRYAVLPGTTGENSVVLKPLNVESMHSVFTSLTLPLSLKFWNSFNTASITLNKIIDSRIEFDSREIKPQFYFYTHNILEVKNLFKIEVMGEYIGSQDDGIYYNKDTYSLSAGISKMFFKNKLMCQFIFNDILRSYRDAGGYTVGQTTVEYDWRMSTHFCRLTLRYNFGKLKNVIYNLKNTGEDELQRTQ